MRKVNHAGHDHVVVVGVVLVFVQTRPDLVCTDLSVVVRQRQDFVSAELDRTGSCTLMCPVLAAITP